MCVWGDADFFHFQKETIVTRSTRGMLALLSLCKMYGGSYMWMIEAIMLHTWATCNSSAATWHGHSYMYQVKLPLQVCCRVNDHNCCVGKLKLVFWQLSTWKWEITPVDLAKTIWSRDVALISIWSKIPTNLGDQFRPSVKIIWIKISWHKQNELHKLLVFALPW